MASHVNPVYEYRRPADLDAPAVRHPVIVVGAGPVGLVAAIDLAQRGVPVVVLDEDCTVSVGSRAICYAKRTLEILDRLGCGERVAQKGVQWHVGRVYFRDAQAYQFDLLPEAGHRRPAFVNLQQYHFEEALVDRARETGVDLRWCHEVVGVLPRDDAVDVEIRTPDGTYRLEAQWLIAADGARSTVRRLMGLDTEGKVFRDRFLIADIRMRSDFPAERRFWFDPPFHPGQSVLLHRQADDVWRVDFQLGWDADPELEKQPERIAPRLRAMLGADVRYELEWASVYTFQCRRMQRFRHGRVIFAGDAAHLVSPFGARGANSGMQDADNLVWKLALVLEGKAPARLLDTYDAERVAAADENIRHSTRSTDFITPKSAVSRIFRDAVLDLARKHAFARRLVNSGRLSTPALLRDSPLNTADEPAAFAGGPGPGHAAIDAPVVGEGGSWLLDHLCRGFTLITFDAIPASAVETLARARIPCATLAVDASVPAPGASVRDAQHHLADRYAARPGTCYLFRPDQHVCARWRAFDLRAVERAIARATCND